MNDIKVKDKSDLTEILEYIERYKNFTIIDKDLIKITVSEEETLLICVDDNAHIIGTVHLTDSTKKEGN